MSTGATLEPSASFTNAAVVNNSIQNNKATANIGFTFLFEGISYTQFVASSNGVIKLGATMANAGGLSANSFATNTDCPRINPCWDDLSTGNVLGYNTGGIYVATTGTAPSRICKIHFAMRNSNTVGAANLFFQVWLYETTGVIEFRYGAGVNVPSASIGIQGVTASNYTAKVNNLAGTSAAWGQSATPDVCTVWPGSGTMYQFRPCYLNGNYTINNTIPTDLYIGGTNFQSFYDAIFYLNTMCSVVGPVVFNVSASQTFNESNPLPQITRTGTAVNTITFQKSGVGANPILVPKGDLFGSTSDESAIFLNGVDYYTFDGIDIISTLGDVEYGFYLYNATTTNGSQNNTFKNFTIDLNTRNSLYNSYGIIQNSFNNTPTSIAGANSNNKYYNFTIRNVRDHGFYFSNTANNPASFPDLGCEIGTLVCNNRSAIQRLGSTNSSITSLESYGIYAWNQQDIKIFNTDISDISGKQTQTCGIYLQNGTGNNLIYNNKIFNVTALNSSSATWVNVYGLRCQLRTGATNNVKIYNNFIGDIKHSYTSSATASIYVYGLYIGVSSGGSNSQSYDVHNNSISIGQGLSPTYSNACFGLEGNSQIYRVRGNIFANFTGNQSSSARHICIQVTAAGLGATGTAFDYNDYFFSNPTGGNTGFNSTASTYSNTLTNWKAFTTGTLDDNSISVNPAFTNNNSDLHTTASGLDAVSGFATEAWVTSDIDCQTRSSLTPSDIGADAFSTSTLPIELISFEAYCDSDNHIICNWSTASELNSDYFIIQKSTDGLIWNNLDTINAAGNSSNKTDYYFKDFNPSQGINYFRLYQFDIDGSFEKLNIIAANCDDKKNQTTVSIYPNPSEKDFYLNLYTHTMQGIGNIIISDITGRIVYEESIKILKGNNTFHLSNYKLQSGLYVIKIECENSENITALHNIKY